MIIKRGILHAFNANSYTATVLLLEATSYALANVTVANYLDSSSALVGAQCAVLFFNENNPQDAVVIAVFDTGNHAIPMTPGRLTFVAGYRQINGDVIGAGVTNSYSLVSGGAGIPSGARGVLYKAYFTSATVGAYIQLAPHGASDMSAYASIGNLAVANGFLNGNGLLGLDGAGKIDIKANSGSCTVTLYTYGYVL